MSNNTKKPSESKRSIKAFFKARNTRRGAASIGVTVLIIAAVILVNVIFAVISSRNAMYIDVTANRSFKLQSATLDYIGDLNKDVDIYVLADEENLENADSSNYSYYVQANRLLHEFEYNSDHISLHYLDPVKNPTFLAQYKDVNRSVSHMMLVTCGDNYTVVDPTDVFNFDTETYQNDGYMVVNSQHVEQAVASAILKVTDSERVTVSVLTGQEEADMSAFASRLAMNAYDVETVNLAEGDISASSEFLVIYKPLYDIDEEMLKKISDWLDNDGKYGHNVIFFPGDELDPSYYPNLSALLSDYGMAVKYGYVFEENSEYIVPGANLNNSLFDYADAEFTEGLSNKSKKIIMGGERGCLAIDVSDITLANALLTSSDSVELFDIKTQELVKVDGVLNGAAIGRKSGASGVNSCVVAVGSYYAVSNLFLTADTYNNAEYFINLFNTLSHKEDVGVIIEGKDPNSAELGVSSVKDIAFLGVLVRFIIPSLALLAGLIIWIKRRHQ